MSYALIAGRALVGVVFLLAAGSKMIGPGAFRAFTGSVAALQPFPRFPGRLAPALAAAVLTAELAVPVLLMAGPAAPLGAALAAVMLTGFAAVLARAIAAGRDPQCRCFGATTAGRGHVIRNLLLAAVAVVVAFAGPAAPVHPAGVVLAIAAGTLLAALFAYADELSDLFAAPAH
jgi:uncharacterized membrane protein YphA (DoxX/SURF4 family)